MIKDLEPGKLYKISWWDILEDSRGNPTEAQPKLFRHTYRFHSIRSAHDGRRRIRYFVFTAGDGPDFYHSIAIPEGCVSRIELIAQ